MILYVIGMIRKNISMYEKDLEKLERLLEKNEGNLSAVVREIIDFFDFMQRKFGSLEEAKKIERRVKGICIPNTLLIWFLKYTEGCLPDEAEAGCIEEIMAIKSMSDLADFADFGFPVAIKIDADDEQNPSEVTIQISGEQMQKEFIAKITSCFLTMNRGMVVKDIHRDAASITVKLKSRGESESEANYKMMRESLITHFGERHVMMQEILQKPWFWNSMINATTDWGDVQRHKYPKIYR